MNGDKFLLDTNIVLYVLNGEEDLITFLDSQHLFLSIITEMELLSFSALSRKETDQLINFIEEVDIVSLDEKVKNCAISLRRKYKLKLPDSIIAAASIVHDIPLLTADKQFKVIKEIQLLLYDPFGNSDNPGISKS